MKFKALEIHTLHVRDFNGEKLIQALGGIKDFEIKTADAERELNALLNPAKLILNKLFKFIILILIGVILILFLTPNAEIFMIKALGFIAIFAGLAGAFAELKNIFQTRKYLLNLKYQDALEFAGWQLALKSAPKKLNNDRDSNNIDYILINNETLNLDAKALALKYNLLSAIAQQAYKIIKASAAQA
ncbi:MAG: hypothetical protein IJP88_05945 [Synergistaceae bacterium]|nr:hypothetical protein [Synergistaceae bacterium]MBR0096702.1 hypothetical protein [Synergistaceae bacterium]